MNKLFLDFDCTIADSIKTYCKVYNELYRHNNAFIEADYNKVQRYDLKDQCNLIDHQENIFSSKDFFNNLILMPYAEEVIRRLGEKYELIICSIGTLDNISYKAQWIKENLSFIKNAILISGDVKAEGIKMDKSSVNMSNSIFIDDHEDNLLSTNAKLKICFGKEYDWNKNWTGERCLNWREVEKLLL